MEKMMKYIVSLMISELEIYLKSVGVDFAQGYYLGRPA